MSHHFHYSIFQFHNTYVYKVFQHLLLIFPRKKKDIISIDYSKEIYLLEVILIKTSLVGLG
jgi:hypothetical protein